jgi:HAD superfamily hydrolase (TIGR01509 family)
VIELVIFDFDGLILDTEGPAFRSWQEIYAAHGCRLDLDTWAVCIGTTDSFDPCADLAARLGRPLDRLALEAERERRFDELLAGEALRPGVTAWMDVAATRGLRLGVASSSSRAWVTGHLDRFGLLERFHAVRCADDVRQVKPEPELYLAVLDALGIPAARAVAVEDSPNGVLAAKRAGLYCVAVPNALTEGLPLDQADLCVPSLAAVTLDAVLDSLI